MDKLKQEHDEVAELLDQLVKSDKAGQRKTLLSQITAALVPHVRAEEKIVYDAVIALKDNQPKQDGKEGYLEQGLVDKTLGSLAKIDNAMSPDSLLPPRCSGSLLSIMSKKRSEISGPMLRRALLPTLGLI